MISNTIKTNSEAITSYTFFSEILPKANKCIEDGVHNRVVFDFSTAKSISALMIPNLMCLAVNLRANSIIPDLIVPSPLTSKKSDVVGFLYRTGFFDISEKYGIFEIDHRLIGDIELYNSNNKVMFYECRPKNKEGCFHHEFREAFPSNYDSNYSTLNKEQSDSDERWKELSAMLGELAWNSIYHGESFSIVSCSKAYGIAYASVSDMGEGLYLSINKKIKKNNFGTFENIDDKDVLISPHIEKCIFDLMKRAVHKPENKQLYAIISSIIFRLDYHYKRPYFGIFSVFHNVLSKGGIIRIHSNDTQVVFTKKHFDKGYFQNPNNDIENINQILKLADELANEKSNIRRHKHLPGVHYEIEFPLKKELS